MNKQMRTLLLDSEIAEAAATGSNCICRWLGPGARETAAAIPNSHTQHHSRKIQTPIPSSLSL
jgi:hypothetical protein